jgi:hypothetical protein
MIYRVTNYTTSNEQYYQAVEKPDFVSKVGLNFVILLFCTVAVAVLFSVKG